MMSIYMVSVRNNRRQGDRQGRGGGHKAYVSPDAAETLSRSFLRFLVLT